jgi:hypothetical protein
MFEVTAEKCKKTWQKIISNSQKSRQLVKRFVIRTDFQHVKIIQVGQ